MAYSVRWPIFLIKNWMFEIVVSATSGRKNRNKGPMNRDVCWPEKWSVEKSEMMTIQHKGGNQYWNPFFILNGMYCRIWFIRMNHSEAGMLKGELIIHAATLRTS